MTKTLSDDQLRRRLAKAACEKYDLLKKRRLKIKQFGPEEITVPRRLRALDQSKVDELAESMDAIGQQQPITVWLDDPDDADQTLYLVAGAHRLTAAIKLGWDEINVILTEDMTEIDRQLWEIDENLMRAELSPTERGEHLARRAEIWNAIPEVGGATCATHDASGRKKTPQQERGFAAETAAATGLSKATINRDLARTEGIIQELRDQIKGTKLDTGTYLDSIKGMEPDEQREKVTADLAEPKKPPPVVATDPAEESLERLKRGWAAWELVLKAETPEARSRFYARQAEIINADWRKSIEGIIQTGSDLIAAKGELPDGEFTKMIETGLPFSRQTAQQLMAITSHPAIANAPPGQHLPPSWTVLALLASLSAEDFKDAQERGLTTKRAPS